MFARRIQSNFAIVVAALSLTVGVNFAHGQDIGIELEIERTELSMSDAVMLNVVVKNAPQDAEMPTMSRLDDFDVTQRGSTTNFSMYNGVTERSVAYNLLLTPTKSGKFTIGPAEMVINGTKYTSNTIVISVTDQPTTSSGAAADKDVFMTAELDKENPYVGEQVTLFVRFYHAVNLLSQPTYTPPQTTDFWSDRANPQTSYYTTINGRRYRVMEITTALFPTRAGDLEIGRAMLETQVPSQSGSRRSIGFGSLFDRGETVNLRTKPLTVKVKSLPMTGRPKNFSGAVGRYSINASAKQTEVEVNTPVSVSFRLQGTGNIKVLPRPEIPDLPDFRTYSGAGDEQVTKDGNILGGIKTFEEVFIPNRQGELTIPIIEYNFFDPERGQYVATRTKPITLHVAPSTQLVGEPAPFQRGSGGRVSSEMKSIRYIKSGDTDFQPVGSILLFEPFYVVTNAAPVLALAFLLVYRRRQDRYSRDVAFARSRGAARQAKKRLKAAADCATASQAEKFFGEIRLAIMAFVADKRNVSPHGLTIQDVGEYLRMCNFNEKEIDNCKRLMQRADYARYSAGSISDNEIQESLKRAEEVLIKLQEARVIANG